MISQTCNIEPKDLARGLRTDAVVARMQIASRPVL
jgi:hypothetical protein